MTFSKTGKILMVVGIVAVLAIAATSFAGWGRGGGRGGNCWGPGAGYGPGGYGAQGYQSNLSEEELAKLNQERRAYFEATSDLREKLYQKELELRSELAKPEPDAKIAAGLQKDISGLESELDQKRLEHRINMRKEFPRGGYQGYGYGPRGRAMGRGMYGGGDCYGGRGGCWN